MNQSEEIVLTRKQRLAGNLAAGGTVIVAGLILLLSGLGVIPASIRLLTVPVLLSAIGLSLLFTAVIQKNSVSLWLACAFLTPALVSFLAAFTPATYGNLYPMYIAIPAVSSFITMFMSKSFGAHFKCITLFGVLSILFSLQSSGVTGWSVALPLIVVFVGLIVIYFAVALFRARDEEDEEDA